MKNKYLFSPSFWGVVLVILGCAFLVDELLNIEIPIFTILISGILIYFGIKLIKGSSHAYRFNNLNLFGSHTLSYSNEMEDFSNVFGEARLDLSEVLIDADKTIAINCVFGEFKIKLSDNLNYKIESSTVFGKTSLIDKTSEGFGNQIFTPINFNSDKPCLLINSNVVFGNIEFYK
jgi:predicted membrane protein